jgi:capsule polysaccharide export protein KpsE/RkpR
MGRVKLYSGWLIAIFLIGLIGAGCGKKETEITRGITPNALNFYILHQEIGAIRVKAGETEAAKTTQYLPSYSELVGRSQKMLKDNELSKEMKRYPEIGSTIDSCLNSGTQFLSLEAQAIRAYSEMTEVKQQLADIRQSVRHNSLLAKKQKPRIDALSAQLSKLQKQLEGYKPGLKRNSQSCTVLLKKYNKLILDSKILEYTNDEKMFGLYDWEKIAEAKKAVKKTTKKKGK